MSLYIAKDLVGLILYFGYIFRDNIIFYSSASYEWLGHDAAWSWGRGSGINLPLNKTDRLSQDQITNPVPPWWKFQNWSTLLIFGTLFNNINMKLSVKYFEQNYYTFFSVEFSMEAPGWKNGASRTVQLDLLYMYSVQICPNNSEILCYTLW